MSSEFKLLMMSNSTSGVNTSSNVVDRNVILDLFRGLSAIAVVLYHYLYRGWVTNEFTVESFYNYNGFFKYGYVGVQFFFMISGFMIAKTALSRTAYQFAKARVLRLYPAYFICLSITLFFTYKFGGSTFYIEPMDAIFNYIMISKMFGVPFVDGAYWTLIYELIFYFWFLVFFTFFRKKLLECFLTLLVFSWILNSLNSLEYYSVFFGGKFIPYFVIGMLFFYLTKERKSLFLKLIIIPVMLMCMSQAYEQAYIKGLHSDVDINPLISTILIVFLILLFFIVVVNPVNIKNNLFIKISSISALLSYPLYLLHQNVGYILINIFHGFEMHPLLNLSVTISIVLLIVLLVSYKFEPFILKNLKQLFTYFECKIGKKSD